MILMYSYLNVFLFVMAQCGEFMKTGTVKALYSLPVDFHGVAIAFATDFLYLFKAVFSLTILVFF